MQDVITTNLPAHRVGPSDLLAISVYDSPELTRSVRVGTDGLIRLPMLTQRIEAAGLLPAELETRIAEALESEQILVQPIVTVTVAEYHSRPITVGGAVRQPLTFQAIAPTRLLDAIAKAGGLTDVAGSEILVRTGGDEEARRIPVRQLIDAADPEVNIRLEGGEEILIPAVEKIFVVGNVKKPGAFVVADRSEATVLQVLALAEGLTPYAAKQAFLYRRGADGQRKEVPVELESIMRRKQADIEVLPNDILYIPESRGKRMTATAIERLLMFGSTAGASALVYGAIR